MTTTTTWSGVGRAAAWAVVAVAAHTPIEAAVRARAPASAERERRLREGALTAAMTVLRTEVTDVRGGGGAATVGGSDRPRVKAGRTVGHAGQSSPLVRV